MPLLHHQFLTGSPDAHPDRWMLVLPGIYGAGRNWASVARRLVQARPDWGAVLVDLRQHGGSMGFPPPHDLDAAAGDLSAVVEAGGLDVRAVLGHSFGGKVALVYSRNPPVPLSRVWVVDSTPDARDADGSAWGMLRVLRQRPGPFADRDAGIAAVMHEGYPRPVAMWMSTNLVHGPDGYRWRLDPDDMEALLRSFFATDAWDAVEAPHPGTHVHVVQGLESSILTPQACARVEAAHARTGQAHLHPVAGGHWLNADNPDALQDLLTRFMD